jgi:hypothetical protein
MPVRSRSRSALRVSFSQVQKVSCTFLVAALWSCQNAAGGGISIEWERPFGTQYSEDAFDSAIDLFGNVVVAGETHGSFTDPNAADRGTVDALVAKYDAHGNMLWGRTLGGTANDAAWSVATDEGGGVYIAGISQTGLGGPPAYGTFPFLARYDAAGEFQWVKQVIANGVNGPYIGANVTTGPAGSVFVSSAASIARYDRFGNHQWTHRLIDSRAYDGSYDFASDSHANLFVAGMTLEGDAFLLKMDEFGNEVWHREFGTSKMDFSSSLVVDDQGHVYVSGATEGDLAAPNAGGRDMFVSRWTSDGELEWTRQVGTPFDDWAHVTKSNDGVFLTGASEDLSDYQAPWSLIAAELTSAGELVWRKDFLSPGYLPLVAESKDGFPTIFVAGRLDHLNTPTGSRDSSDIYLAKLRVVPEPSSLNLIVLFAACCFGASSRCRTDARQFLRN